MAEFVPIPILPYFEAQDGEMRRARFWSKVIVRDRSECWDWSASRTTSGYGRFKIDSYVTVHANRVALALHLGRDPGEWQVLHSCDRPSCCNPHHLRLGTPQDNIDDKVARGRCGTSDQTGASNGAAKIDEETLQLIVSRLHAGWNNTRIAKDLPVSHALISRIRRGRSWVTQTAKLGWSPMPKYEHLRPRVIPLSSPSLEGER